MAKAKPGSSAKSESKKQVAKASAAGSKTKAGESKKGASPGAEKETAKTAARAPGGKAASSSSAKTKKVESKSLKAESAKQAEKAPHAREQKAPAVPAPEVKAQKGEEAVSDPVPSAQRPSEKQVAPPEAKPAPIAKPPAEPEAVSEVAALAEEPKLDYEPIGPNMLDGFELPAIYGKAGVFGGPKDRSGKPDDKLALPTGLHFQYERYRSLNPKSFYCAMRWDYRQEHKSTEEGKRWWANKKLLIANPLNGKSVIARAVDYGPHESTGLAISVSPGAAEALGINPGDEVLVAFADPKAPTGAVA